MKTETRLDKFQLAMDRATEAVLPCDFVSEFQAAHAALERDTLKRLRLASIIYGGNLESATPLRVVDIFDELPRKNYLSYTSTLKRMNIPNGAGIRIPRSFMLESLNLYILGRSSADVKHPLSSSRTNLYLSKEEHARIRKALPHPTHGGFMRLPAVES